MHGDKRLLLAAGSAGAALTLALARLGPRLFHGTPLLGLTVAALALASGSLLAEALGVAAAVVELALGLAAALAGAEPGPVLDSLAQLGAVFIMYMAGLEVDAEVLSRRLAASLASGTASFTAPLAVGALALTLAGYTPGEAALASIACSTTSVAVVYAITRRAGIARSPLGQVVLAAAMVADVESILAFAAAAGPGAPALAYMAASTLAALAAARLLDRLAGKAPEAEVRILLALLAGMALLGEAVGAHAILYAFILGAATRKTIASRPTLEDKLNAVTFGLLAPLFFVDAGLHAAPANPLHYAETAALLLAATLPAKIASTHAALTLTLHRRIPARLTTVFAARLTVSTIIAYAGEATGTLPHDLAGAIILSALIATITAAAIAGKQALQEQA